MRQTIGSRPVTGCPGGGEPLLAQRLCALELFEHSRVSLAAIEANNVACQSLGVSAVSQDVAELAGITKAARVVVEESAGNLVRLFGGRALDSGAS